MRRMRLWLLVGALLAVAPEARAGDAARAEALIGQQRYDDAIALIQEAMRGKLSYTELQALKALLDQALFARAEQDGTPDAYTTYLRLRPSGANAGIARQRLCGGAMLTAEQQQLCAGAPAAPVVASSPVLTLSLPSTLPSVWPDVDTAIRTGAQAPADAALVIGNEDYAFLPDVPYARADAVAFYQWLVYSRGVPTASAALLDGRASREMIEQAAAGAVKKVGRGGTLWVYFSGHGAASPTDGSRLLLGDDARSEMSGFESRSVRVDALRKMAEDAGVRAVFLLDTCYSGAGRNGETLLAGRRIAVPAWALEPPEAQILEWSAAGPDQLSGPITGARHGAFTWFVLGSLRGWADGAVDGQRDGTVTAAEADAYVRQGLSSLGITDQTPVMVAADPAAWQLGSGGEKGPDLAKLRLSGQLR